MFVHTVAHVGGHLEDGHRTSRAWRQAACNWSSAEAGRLVKAGAMLAQFPSAVVLAQAGELGVAQLHALSSVVANPRVKEHLADGEATLVGAAVSLDYPDYLTFLNTWVAAADPDGAHQSAERAHRNRHARIGILGNECFLDAAGGATQGVQSVRDRQRCGDRRLRHVDRGGLWSCAQGGARLGRCGRRPGAADNACSPVHCATRCCSPLTVAPGPRVRCRGAPAKRIMCCPGRRPGQPVLRTVASNAATTTGGRRGVIAPGATLEAIGTTTVPTAPRSVGVPSAHAPTWRSNSR